MKATLVNLIPLFLHLDYVYVCVCLACLLFLHRVVIFQRLYISTTVSFPISSFSPEFLLFAFILPSFLISSSYLPPSYCYYCPYCVSYYFISSFIPMFPYFSVLLLPIPSPSCIIIIIIIIVVVVVVVVVVIVFVIIFLVFLPRYMLLFLFFFFFFFFVFFFLLFFILLCCSLSSLTLIPTHKHRQPPLLSLVLLLVPLLVPLIPAPLLPVPLCSVPLARPPPPMSTTRLSRKDSLDKLHGLVTSKSRPLSEFVRGKVRTISVDPACFLNQC